MPRDAHPEEATRLLHTEQYYIHCVRPYWLTNHSPTAWVCACNSKCTNSKCPETNRRRCLIIRQSSKWLNNITRHQHRSLKCIVKTKGIRKTRVLLRWLLQRGICVIPKSTNEERIKANFDVRLLIYFHSNCALNKDLELRV